MNHLRMHESQSIVYAHKVRRFGTVCDVTQPRPRQFSELAKKKKEKGERRRYSVCVLERESEQVSETPNRKSNFHEFIFCGNAKEQSICELNWPNCTE